MNQSAFMLLNHQMLPNLVFKNREVACLPQIIQAFLRGRLLGWGEFFL